MLDALQDVPQRHGAVPRQNSGGNHEPSEVQRGRPRCVETARAHPAVGSPSRHRATSPQSEMDGIWLETGCDTTWTGNRGPEEWR